MSRPQGDRSAVFVDRDGVICENRPDHVKAWSEFAFVPGSVDALASLSRAGVRLFIVSNQAIIARGLASRRTVDEINDRMVSILESSGARIEAVTICPHDAADHCACRKPEPGMLLDVADRFDVDLQRSFMIGDAASDIEAGARAGCETVLVRTGRFSTGDGAKCQPTFVADDLIDAALWVMMRRAERFAPSDLGTV